MSSGAWLVDPWAFARTSSRRNGAMDLVGLPRLASAVVSAVGKVDVSAGGFVAEDKRSYVQIEMSGAVWLVCQRCLEPVEHLIRHVALFQLWPQDLALPDDELAEDGYDALSAGNELDLVQLVEDELLLGLPISPRHANCVTPRLAEGASKDLPFDALKKLKRAQ